MIAVCLIRDLPHYRRHAFEAGLRRTGYRLVDAARPSGPGDLLVIWNRYGQFEQRADRWEAEGGTTLVCENGYLGADEQGRQFYAIAARGHNGSGWIVEGGPARFDSLGIEPQPWRSDGELVLVRGQRGIGTRLMASPANWHVNAGKRLQTAQPLPVLVRDHPGRHAAPVPIEQDLASAAACVIWCSSVGVKALVTGVPIWYDAPHWVCAGAGRRLKDDQALVNPMRDDTARARALDRMASSQWSIAEIETGEPFARFRHALLHAATPYAEAAA